MTVKLNGRRIVLIGGRGFMAITRLWPWPNKELQSDSDSLQVNNLLWFALTIATFTTAILPADYQPASEMLNAAGIPMHAGCSRLSCALTCSIESIPMSSFIWLQWPMRVALIKIPSAPSITVCAPWKTLSTMRAGTLSISSSFLPAWCMAIFLLRRLMRIIP